MERLKGQIYDIVAAEHPQTVRQVFYQMVTAGLIDKTENKYRQTVSRLLVEMRRESRLPFDWIGDNTRWMRKPRSYSSLADALESTARTYRRAVWTDQDIYLEVWLEKEALAGVLMEETEKWDVPLMVTRGYSSVTYLYSAAQTIAYHDKPAVIYYFGDHDPSGKDISRAVEKGLREFAPMADITFTRVAVTEGQIQK